MNEDRSVLRIYYVELDEQGNEIGRGVHPKKYLYHGVAHRTAEKLYGDRSRYVYDINFRDPFKVYYEPCQCDACGRTYERIESTYGGKCGSYLHIRKSFMPATKLDMRSKEYYKKRAEEYDKIRNRKSGLDICDDCYEKIHNFIDSLKEEEHE